MKRWIILALLINMVTLVSHAQRVDPLIDSANHAYSQENYDQAVNYYKQVLSKGIESAGLYYNLGNAYYKSHDIARAILNYERALLRDPNNEDIQYNLELARKQTTDRIEQIPEFFLSRWARHFVDLFSSNLWAVISIITFIGFLVLFSVYLYSNRLSLRKISFWVAVLSLVVSVSSFVFSYQQKQDVANSKQAIVFAPKVTVRSSPSESGTELFVVHEGTKVSIVDNDIEGWYEVKLADGNKGWLRRKTVEPI